MTDLVTRIGSAIRGILGVKDDQNLFLVVDDRMQDVADLILTARGGPEESNTLTIQGYETKIYETKGVKTIQLTLPNGVIDPNKTKDIFNEIIKSYSPAGCMGIFHAKTGEDDMDTRLAVLNAACSQMNYAHLPGNTSEILIEQ